MLSRIAYICCCMLVLSIAFIFYPKWNNKNVESSLGWDACTYYWYLPATFIYQDLKEQKFGDSVIEKYSFTPTFQQSFVHESGNRVITYSSGLAVLQLPAFAAAHALAAPLGYEADGFSQPYQVAIQLWGLIWVLIGLWFFRRLLLYYYNDKTVAITLLLLVLGTNYLNYHAIDVTLTHCWLFTGYTFLMLATRRFYYTPSYKHAAYIGLITGMLILIRPSEMVAILIPLLWGMESIGIAAIRHRFLFYLHQYKQILLAVCCAILVGSIQVLYWYYVTGEFFVYSYDDKGFSWKSPHFFNYTFSYRSGWLVYTPLLMFAFIGLLPFLRYGKNKVAVIVFFLLNYYIVCAWDVWWYGGMGGRAMVQSYAVLFFIIAALVQALLQTRWLKWPVFAVMMVFAYVNIWFTYNAHGGAGLYDPNGMTKAYYWAVVGRFHVPKHSIRYKDTDEFFDGKPQNMKQLYNNDFEDDSTATTENPISGQRSLYFDGTREYSPKMRIAYRPGQADWVRATASVRINKAEWEVWKKIQFTIGFKDEKLEDVKTRMVRINHLMDVDSAETQVYFDVKIPEQSFDSLDILFWNPGSKWPVMIDDVALWSFDE